MASTADKVSNLKKYSDDLRNRIKNNIVPSRRVGEEGAYFDFLKRELRKTEGKIERIILSGTK